MALIKIPKKQRAAKLAKLTDEQKQELEELEANALANFEGAADELETALGMLRLGHHVGWKVLYVVHSKRTIRKYEDILGIKVRDIFPETGPSSYRSYGLIVVEKFTNFWKAISGEQKIDRRRDIGE